MKLKRTMFLSMIILAVGVLSSCTLFQTLEIYPGNVVGMIDEEFVQVLVLKGAPGVLIDSLKAGYSVEWSVTGGSGITTVDYGDGIIEEVDGDVVTHTYTKAGYYEPYFTRGRMRGSASVTVRPIEFDLYHPFWTQGEMVGKREEILFDPFPRIVNCNNPDSYLTGVWPSNEDIYMIPGPFGDMHDPDKLSAAFEMRIYVTTTDGSGGYAYGKSGDVITHQWVPLQTYRVIADWPWAKPPYPLQVLQKGCDPGDPLIPPPGAFLVRQETRRVSGGNGEAVQFEIYVANTCATGDPTVCE